MCDLRYVPSTVPSASMRASGIEEGVAVALEHADRQNHRQLARHLAKVLDRRMSGPWPSPIRRWRGSWSWQKSAVWDGFLQQDDLRAALGGLADQALAAGHVGVAIPTAGHLRGRYGNLAHRATILMGLSLLHAGYRGVFAQKVGGELALTISHSSRPTLRNRCGNVLLK